MRFKVTLQSIDRRAVLPINYQYPLSSWIYKTLEQGDPDLAGFLHEEGYAGDGHRRYKFYSFSELRTPGARVNGDRLVLTRPEAEFAISFLADQAAQGLVMGMFRQAGAFWLGDGESGVNFTVSSVEMLKPPDFEGSADFFTVSPVVISVSEQAEDGRPAKRYLSPLDEGFEAQFLGNLRQKYKAALDAGLLPPGADPDPDIEYRLLSDHAKEKRIDLMRNRPGYTRVRGYKFRFRLTAPKEVLHLVLLAGVGEKNAMGFGGVEVVGKDS